MPPLRGLLLLLAAPLLLAQGKPLGPAATALAERAFAGLPQRPLVDVHAHLVDLGKDGTWVNPEKLTLRHPMKRLQTSLYLKASGAKDLAHFDEAFEATLLERMAAFPKGFRLHLFAFDHAYTDGGQVDLAHSEIFVPNEAVIAFAQRHPERIAPVLSIHPYRADALAELERGAARGARYVKWLPNAQNIDPADPRCEAFYLRMRDLGMVLLTHVGEEKAVHAEQAQALGNPLRFRRALDLGLTVIMAHCASLGTNEDLDHPGRRASNFDLFLRLMAESKYEGRLWGDISAITQINRLEKPLLGILHRPELQRRLLNGSDYPLPGVDLVIWTRRLRDLGLITRAERKALNEIFKANPLLFDFVLKRTLRTRAGESLAPEIFTARPELPVGLLVP